MANKTYECRTCGKEFIRTNSAVWCCDDCRPLRAKPELIKAIKGLLADEYGLVCSYCGINLKDIRITLDHIKPVSQGGSDDITNLTLACWHCNQSKGVCSVDEFLSYIKHIRSDEFNCAVLVRVND